MFWIALLIWALATVVYHLVKPKPDIENAKPQGFGSFHAPTVSVDRHIPMVWGRRQVKGPNVMWYGRLRFYPDRHEDDDDVIIGYFYYMSLAMAVCLGPAILRTLMLNDDPVFTPLAPRWLTDKLTGDDLSTTFSGGGTFRAGSTTQPRDNILYSMVGSHQANLPAYRRLAYIVYGNNTAATTHGHGIWGPAMYVGKGGPSIMNISFIVDREVNPLGLTTYASPGAPGNINPINCIYECLIDDEWGMAISPAEIDTANFISVANTVGAESNCFSYIVDTAIEILDLINEVLRQIDGILYFDRTVGLWRMKLIRDDYLLATLPVFDESNVVELKEYGRQSWADTVNEVKVVFHRRGLPFRDDIAMAQDIANMDLQGRVNTVEVRYPGVTDQWLANRIAVRELRVQSYPLARLTIVVNRYGFHLNVGDVFKFSWEALGIVEGIFRISKINYGKLGDSLITLVSTQDIYGIDEGMFGDDPGDFHEIEYPVPVEVADYLLLEMSRLLSIRRIKGDASGASDDVLGRYRWLTFFKDPDPDDGLPTTRIMARIGTVRPIVSEWFESHHTGGFCATGTLRQNLAAYAATSARPVTAFNMLVNADDGDELGHLLQVYQGLTSVAELRTICFIENTDPDIPQPGEWIGYEEFTDETTHYAAKRLWRGLFNSTPQFHPLGQRVWFLESRLATGGQVTPATTMLINTSATLVDLRLDSPGQIPEDDITGPIKQLTATSVFDSHLPSRDPVYNNVYAPASVSLDTQYTAETGRTGHDARAIKLEWIPRDRLHDNHLDDHTVTDDYEGHRFGVNVLDRVTIEEGYVELTSPIVYFSRNLIIMGLPGVAPTPVPASVKFQVLHRRQSVGQYATELTGRMVHAITLTTALTGLNHGRVEVGDTFAIEYGETGTYNFDIYTALPSSGVLEASVNGGAWVAVVTAGNTTGSLVVTADDEVELRTTVRPSDDQFFSFAGPVSEVGYGVLKS